MTPSVALLQRSCDLLRSWGTDAAHLSALARSSWVSKQTRQDALNRLMQMWDEAPEEDRDRIEHEYLRGRDRI